MAGQTATWTAYDGSSPYADFTASGALAVRYLRGDAVDEVLGQAAASGSVEWYLEDELGSVRQVVDGSGGVLDKVDYDAFGQVTGELDRAAGVRFGYAGGVADAATGQEQFGRRYYASALGVWTSADPIGYAAGDADTHRYAGNDPVDAVDPSGLEGFYLGGVHYVMPWSPNAGGVGATLNSYGQTLAVTGAGAAGGGLGSGLSGGVAGGTLGSVAGPGGLAVGMQGGALSGLGWGSFTSGLQSFFFSPPGQTMRGAFQSEFDSGIKTGGLYGLGPGLKAGLPASGGMPGLGGGGAATLQLTVSGVSAIGGFGRAAAIGLNLARNPTGPIDGGGQAGGEGANPADPPAPNNAGTPRPTYDPSPKHGTASRGTSKGVSSPAPTNGQAALDNSIQVKPTSPRRVGVDPATGEIVVFDETTPGVFHGHVPGWDNLHPDMQRALIKAGQVTQKGKVK